MRNDGGSKMIGPLMFWLGFFMMAGAIALYIMKDNSFTAQLVDQAKLQLAQSKTTYDRAAEITDKVEALDAALAKLTDQVTVLQGQLEVQKKSANVNVAVAAQAKPFLIEVIDHRDAKKAIGTAVLKAKAQMKRSQVTQ